MVHTVRRPPLVPASSTGSGWSAEPRTKSAPTGVKLITTSTSAERMSTTSDTAVSRRAGFRHGRGNGRWRPGLCRINRTLRYLRRHEPKPDLPVVSPAPVTAQV